MPALDVVRHGAAQTKRVGIEASSVLTLCFRMVYLFESILSHFILLSRALETPADFPSDGF